MPSVVGAEPSVVVHTWDPSAWHVKAEGQEFKVMLDSRDQNYMRPYFNATPLPPLPLVLEKNSSCWQQCVVVIDYSFQVFLCSLKKFPK